ncbi:MAG: hypothetical protein DRR42_19300 [Gammaproteobacteria bacterium]|nr:MAG: hypothetical protein DRR42_19300 [Gammaproteobacteria bacterium]
MISHRQLAHALALFKHGNFTRAAMESHLSQSAFSRSIRSLENELGVLLFDRYGNIVTPTVYGKALIRRAEVILADTEEIEREIGLIKGLEVGSFSVALGIYPAEIAGNEAVGKMALSHPHIRYRVTLGNWEYVNQQVLNREVDIGLASISDAEDDERLETQLVGQHEMIMYVRKEHPLAGATGLTLEDMDAFPFVSIRIPSALAPAIPGVNEIDENTGLLIPAIEIDQLAAATTIVATSNGIGAALPVQIESQLEAGELKIIKCQQPWIKPPYGFIYLRNRSASPAAELFIEHVCNIEKHIIEKNERLIKKFCR